MAADLKSRLPPCGLFRTTQALPAHEQRVPAGVLVYFHNHSDAGLPQVVLPDHCVRHRWHFHGPGIAFRALSWAGTLIRLPDQGLYVLRSDLAFRGGKWPRRTLVQLGYTRAGAPVAFLAHQRSTSVDGDIYFPERGLSLQADQLALLHGPLHVLSDPGSDCGSPEDLAHPVLPHDADDMDDPGR